MGLEDGLKGSGGSGGSGGFVGRRRGSGGRVRVRRRIVRRGMRGSVGLRMRWWVWWVCAGIHNRRRDEDEKKRKMELRVRERMKQ